MLKRHKGRAFNCFAPWLSNVTNDLKLTQRIPLRIGKRMQQESLTNPRLFGDQRVLNGYVR
jgi:hypothetical protein